MGKGGHKALAVLDHQTLVFLEPSGDKLYSSEYYHSHTHHHHSHHRIPGSCSRPTRHQNQQQHAHHQQQQSHYHQQQSQQNIHGHNHNSPPNGKNAIFSNNNNNNINNNNNNSNPNMTEGKAYEFDYVFDENATQEDVYRNTTAPLVKSVFEGFCSTVFAYGCTGSGKTYTMVGTQTNYGIMARSVEDIFQQCSSNKNSGNKVEVFLSYLEIYNEQIRDLLKPTGVHLELREDKDQIHVAGLSEIKAKSSHEVLNLLQRGNRARTIESTSANVTSSRSHAVLTVTVRQESSISGDVTEGKLFLIDLAGSERASNTKNSGLRLREGAHINRSLLALANCITALASGDGEKYINYRDSKLTRLLKSALGGNSKTAMIAHVGPANFQIEETRNTLLYAQRARAISNRIRKFIFNPSQSEPSFVIQELRNEVKRLQAKLEERSRSPPTPSKELVMLEDYSDLHPTSMSPQLHQEFLGKHEKPDLSGIKKEITGLFDKEFKLRNELLRLDGAMLQSALDCEILRLMVLDWENLKQIRDSDVEDNSEDSDPGRHEINSVMNELKTVRQEQHKLLKTRNEVELNLKATRARISQVEDEAVQYLPEIQREILSHLCKLQQDQVQKMSIEIENELKRRGSLLLRCLRQKALGEAIIARQRHFINAVSGTRPNHLTAGKHSSSPTSDGGSGSGSGGGGGGNGRIESSFLPRLAHKSPPKTPNINQNNSPGTPGTGNSGINNNVVLQQVKCDVHSPPRIGGNGHSHGSTPNKTLNTPPTTGTTTGNTGSPPGNNSTSYLPPLINGSNISLIPNTTKYSEFKKARQAQRPRSSSDDDMDEEEMEMRLITLTAPVPVKTSKSGRVNRKQQKFVPTPASGGERGGGGGLKH